MTHDFTLEDIEKLINKSSDKLEAKLTERFDASLDKFQIETREEFRAVRREFRMSQAN